MKIIENIKYGQYNECLCDLYLPDTKNFKTIVYFHGGGLKEGDKFSISLKEMAEYITSNNYAFISCNYRMYPTYKFPDYLYDASDAVKYAFDHIKEYGGSGDIILSGQSAGAWISMMLCFNKEYLNENNIEPTDIYSWVIESGQATSHFNVIIEEEGLDYLAQRIDKYAPLYYSSKDTQFTNMLLMVYEDDLPCRKEQNYLLYTNVLCYNKDAKIKYTVLPGYHCYGSSNKDSDGLYRYSKELVSYLNSLE